MLYVPVLHAGYLRLFAKWQSTITELYLPNDKLIKELVFLEPEVRAIAPQTMVDIIRASKLMPVAHIQLMNPEHMPNLKGKRIITVDEGFSRRLVQAYYPDNAVEYDSIFLRWDEASVIKTEPAGFDRVSTDEIDRAYMVQAVAQAELSGDWWRQVGGVLVRDGDVILTSHNRHVPSQLSPYAEGDPRDFVAAGTNPELATTLHCEQVIFTEAARQGIGTSGTSLYVSVFPCPMCAKQIAYSGIEKVYFRTGHASLDGQRILNERGVEIILVPG